MLRILATTFAGLLGLCFGSFLNVCVSRWPKGESVVRPRSHCRDCGRTLAWWENIPLVSWIALRGKCRTCGAGISVRYVVVEVAVGGLWAYLAFRRDPDFFYASSEHVVAMAVLCFVLVGLAAMDSEHLWLPNAITLPMIPLGMAWNALLAWRLSRIFIVQPRLMPLGASILTAVGLYLAGIVVAAGIILFSRWLYWLIRRREGVGMGDVKLMAMLGAWLGLPGALLALFIGIMLGAVAGIGLLLKRRTGPSEAWAASKLPFGTFICIGGIVSALWGQPILTAYMRWAGF